MQIADAPAHRSGALEQAMNLSIEQRETLDC
jgi:hypothetical protein